MYLYHYFEKERGPFISLSDLPNDEVQKLIDKYRVEDVASGHKTVVGSVYSDDNIGIRRNQEYMTRTTFIEKGGKPIRQFPYYMILGNEDTTFQTGLKGWYKNGDSIKILVEEFDMSTISFTYGDQCQTVNPSELENFKDNKYRPPVYTYGEILEVINERGWLFVAEKDWSEPWYVEAQVWSDDATLNKYRQLYQ